MQSDLSVFHRIDDVWMMPAQSLADKYIRLAAYRGMIRAIVETELHEQPQDPPNGAVAGMASKQERRVVESDAHTLQSDPDFQGMFEVKVAADAGQGIQAP